MYSGPDRRQRLCAPRAACAAASRASCSPAPRIACTCAARRCPTPRRSTRRWAPCALDREALAALRALPFVEVSDARPRARALARGARAVPAIGARAISRWCRSSWAMPARRRWRSSSRRCGAATETLVVVSSDLSHYLPYEAARARDRAHRGARSSASTRALEPEEACGAAPINGLLEVARRRGLDAELRRPAQLRRHRGRPRPRGGLRGLRLPRARQCLSARARRHAARASRARRSSERSDCGRRRGATSRGCASPAATFVTLRSSTASCAAASAPIDARRAAGRGRRAQRARRRLPRSALPAA